MSQDRDYRPRPRTEGGYDAARRSDHQQLVAVLFKIAHAADEVVYGKGDEDEAEDGLAHAIEKLDELRPTWRDRRP